MTIIYKKLAESFTKWGERFDQIKREGDVAIFRRTNKTGKEQFEVVVISRHNGYEVQGVKIEPSETYPSSSAWGTYGWTTNTRERAEELFVEAIKRTVGSK